MQDIARMALGLGLVLGDGEMDVMDALATMPAAKARRRAAAAGLGSVFPNIVRKVIPKLRQIVEGKVAPYSVTILAHYPQKGAAFGGELNREYWLAAVRRDCAYVFENRGTIHGYR